jgi:hypothetical protein
VNSVTAPPLLVLADTPALATAFADANRLGGEGARWRYVRHVDQVRDLLDQPGRFVVLCAPGKRRLDAIQLDRRGEIIAALKRAGYVRVGP